MKVYPVQLEPTHSGWYATLEKNKEFDITLKTKPFCSKRCSYVDLNNWLREKYAIEANENDYDKDI